MNHEVLCSYCKIETQNPNICDFCMADLTAPRPQIDPMLDDSKANYSQPELTKLHTYDLLLILRHLRAERTSMYKTMQSVRKAPQEAKKSVNNYEELNESGQELYREVTARKNIVEQILIDRMGYYPKRIDDKLLNALKTKIERG